MDYTDGTILVKHQWDAIHDPGLVIGMFERDEEGASIWKGKRILLDEKHTLLLNHVYDNNNTGDLKYLEKIEKSRLENSTLKSLQLDYAGKEETNWINQWKLRTETSDEILAKIIKKIQDAKDRDTIKNLSLFEKGIYLGKYTLGDAVYPIAVYSNKAEISNLVKVQVSELADLEKDENKKFIRSEETHFKYLIIAFYEEGATEPSLIMQIEKFDISEWQNTKEVWLKFLKIITKKENTNTKKIEITEDQLHNIFPDTPKSRIKDVVSTINNISADYNINTVQRMAQFLGQIGAETGGLNKLEEGANYSAKVIFNIFLKPNLKTNSSSISGKTFKYCDLVDGYDCTDITTCPSIGNGHSDCNKAINVELDDNEKCKWSYDDFDKLCDVKSNYVNSTSLFDYVYGCRMGNGAMSSKDGSTFLGKGFIHLTGKGQYKRISDEWNKLYPNDKKNFDGKDINLLESNIEVAMKASMIYWNLNKLNEKADEGTDDNSIDNVGKIINGSGKNLPNGYETRRAYCKAALKNLKN
jgi:predicted chitinase